MSNEVAVKEDVNVFQLFDKLDDEIILAELEHRIVNHWCYHFNQQGQEVWGLSKKGVDQALMELEKQGIIYDEPIVTIQTDPTNPDYILFFSNVRKSRYDSQLRKIDMGSLSGYKRQPIKGPDGKEDRFWFEKGAAKATRNAKARTIPVEMETKIIALAKSQGKVKTVEEPEGDGEIVEHKTETEHKASEKQVNYLKGLVQKKLGGMYDELCIEFKAESKEQLLDNLTVSKAKKIIDFLIALKS